MKNAITPKEASMLLALLESNTTTQERKSDERVRQSVWRKLRAIVARGET